MKHQILVVALLFFSTESVIGSSKPVSIRDTTIGQLVTSSLLTWESFNIKNDAKHQFEFAIKGGTFTDVR